MKTSWGSGRWSGVGTSPDHVDLVQPLIFIGHCCSRQKEWQTKVGRKHHARRCHIWTSATLRKMQEQEWRWFIESSLECPNFRVLGNGVGKDRTSESIRREHLQCFLTPFSTLQNPIPLVRCPCPSFNLGEESSWSLNTCSSIANYMTLWGGTSGLNRQHWVASSAVTATFMQAIGIRVLWTTSTKKNGLTFCDGKRFVIDVFSEQLAVDAFLSCHVQHALAGVKGIHDTESCLLQLHKHMLLWETDR